MDKWRWVKHGEVKLYDIGIDDDGTLHNPNGYDEQTVREAIQSAKEEETRRRKEAAKKASETRRKRREKEVYRIAKAFVEGRATGPRSRCRVCGRKVTDHESIERGIGSECWQSVLEIIYQICDEDVA